MGPTTLGTKAVVDPSPLRQITRGRSPSLRTADRVLAFIAACELDSGGARAPPARPGRACRGARSTGGRRRDASPRRSGWAGAWCAGSRPRSGSASGWRRAGAAAPRRHRPADGAASGGDASDERPPGLTTVPERANDVRVRCALRRFGGAHRDRRTTAGAAWACVHAACAARAARAAQAVTGATRQSEGLVRVRGRVCLRTTCPRPLRVAPAPAIRPGRVSSAAPRRRRTRWPTGRPSGCPASAEPDRDASRSGSPFAFPHGIVGPERPLAGRGEGVKTHSALSRTKPSERGVAPATAKAARSAAVDRAAWPQEVGSAADSGLPPCESPGSRNVNRPPTSFSHRGAA